MTLTLKNANFFGLKSAVMKDSHLIVTDMSGNRLDWLVNSNQGGKLVFSRTYGKGAIWKEVKGE